MLQRETVLLEITKTQSEIRSLKEQIQLKEVYLDSLKAKQRNLDEIERMG